MFCDRCDRGYHTYCVGLQAIPEGSWQCSMCDPPVAPSPPLSSSPTTLIKAKRGRPSTNRSVSSLRLIVLVEISSPPSVVRRLDNRVKTQRILLNQIFFPHGNHLVAVDRIPMCPFLCHRRRARAPLRRPNFPRPITRIRTVHR